MSRAIRLSYGGWGVEADAKVRNELKKTASNFETKVVVIGGKSSADGELIDLATGGEKLHEQSGGLPEGVFGLR